MVLDTSYENVNAILVVLFNEIMGIEGEAICTEEFQDLTYNDMHILDAVGVEESRNMSAIAKRLRVTMGTLTVAMNGLVRKGYVTRERGEADRRVVYIRLTEKGRRAYESHNTFHQEMIEAAIEELNDEEKRILVQTLEKLKAFFLNYKELFGGAAGGRRRGIEEAQSE